MEQKKQPKNDIVISLAGANIDTTIVTIEEMHLYSEKRKRIAIVTTEKKTYGELDRMNYQLIGNYSKPKVLAINTRNKPYFDVYTYLLEKYKSGLLIAESDTISENISELICKSNRLSSNDIDVMICRDGFESMTQIEMERANFLRIHANPDQNMMIFQTIGDFYKEKVLGIMISQFYVNHQFEESNKYFERLNEEYTKRGFSDFVDYYQLNKQLSFCAYFDVFNNKILNINKETVASFMKVMKAQGLLPIPDDQIIPIAESITIN